MRFFFWFRYMYPYMPLRCSAGLCMSIAAQQGAGATKGCWLEQATPELRMRGNNVAQASMAGRPAH